MPARSRARIHGSVEGRRSEAKRESLNGHKMATPLEVARSIKICRQAANVAASRMVAGVSGCADIPFGVARALGWSVRTAAKPDAITANVPSTECVTVKRLER